MKRRKFLKNTAVAGALGGIAYYLPEVSAKDSENDGGDGYDLVAVHNGDPSKMFEAGIAALGGMGKFVKKGQTVVVKPNIGWARTPDFGANTNPDLVKTIIDHCFQAGAKNVYVFDHTCNNQGKCYAQSGIEHAVGQTRGKLVSGNNQKDYQKMALPKGKRLKTARIHQLVKKCDVLINVPVLKNHGGAVMTCAMKNLMGIVWNRGFFHKNNLQQCIADMVTARKPDLNVVDAYRVMKKGGPRGRNKSDVVEMKYQLISPDIVAIDTAASKILGIDSARIPYLKFGEELGLGTTKIDKLNIKRIKLNP